MCVCVPRQGVLCSTLTGQQLVAAIRDVRLDLFNTGIKVNVFDDNGDGEVGYKVYEVAQDGGDGLVYRQVSYNIIIIIIMIIIIITIYLFILIKK